MAIKPRIAKRNFVNALKFTREVNDKGEEDIDEALTGSIIILIAFFVCAP